MWEVMTLAMVPYPGVSSYKVLRFLKAGKRLDQPLVSRSRRSNPVFSNCQYFGSVYDGINELF